MNMENSAVDAALRKMELKHRICDYLYYWCES